MRMTGLQDIRQWAKNARPVFICGLERSGTSILQLSLSRHPDLFAVKDVYETFVFVKPRAVLENPPPHMVLAYLQGKGNAERFRHLVASLAPDVDEVSDADLIRAFFYFNAHEVYGGRRPLEKTPGHVRRIKRMLELFPQAKVIVCTRDPVSIVASYWKRLAAEKALGKGEESWGWMDKTAEQLIAHFQDITDHIVQARALWPQQLFVAPYDWITDRPEESLRALCAFAGLPFVHQIMQPKEVMGREVDLLLSAPITKRDPDDDKFVDAQTQQLIRKSTQSLEAIWSTPGLQGS